MAALGERVEGRLSALEGAENPFAEISEQLTRLYAQKDATVETVFARLAPLEAKLAEVEAPAGARIRRRRWSGSASGWRRRGGAGAGGGGARGAARGPAVELEAAENPFAEISEQLTRLYAQKDATVETVFARLAPLEAKLAEVEASLAARDPAAALERFGERLEAARAAQGRGAALGAVERLAALEARRTRSRRSRSS